MKQTIQDQQIISKHIVFSCFLLLFGAILILALIMPLKRAASSEAKIQAEQESNIPQDPLEAKKKRVAEIIEEMAALRDQVQKNPKLMEDAAITEKGVSLSEEGEALMREITGGDLSKEDAVMIGIIKRYAPAYLGFVEDMLVNKRHAQIAATSARLENIQMALEQYRFDYASYPPTIDALIRVDDSSPKVPYLSSEDDLKDLWGNTVIYKRVNSSQFTLKSPGPDGKSGTTDDIELK